MKKRVKILNSVIRIDKAAECEKRGKNEGNSKGFGRLEEGECGLSCDGIPNEEKFEKALHQDLNH